MALHALASLVDILKRLDRSSQVSDVNFYPYLSKTLGQVMKLIEEISKSEKRRSSRSSRDEKLIADLDRQMKQAICKLVDVLESYLVHRCLSQSGDESLGEDQESRITVIDEKEVEQEINIFIDTMKMINEEYITEKGRLSDSVRADDVSSIIGFGEKNSKVVGLDDELKKLKDRLTGDGSKFFKLVSIHGMVGIGKTTLTKEIYEDPLILSHFQIRIWITLGPKYNFRNILLGILTQTNPDININNLGNEEMLCRHVYRSLEGKKYLLVLDDVWDTRLLDVLPTSSTNKDDSSGARIILTTRLKRVASYGLDGGVGYIHYKKLLSKQQSWSMFLKKVFPEDLRCPDELEKVGKKIVDNCEGLPFAIISVCKHLSKTEKTLEYWNKVAEKKIHVFDDPDDEKVIYSGYKYLPQAYRYFFLYMGVFPQGYGYQIPVSKLIKLWYAEGLLVSNPSNPDTIEDKALKKLGSLYSQGCVMVRQRSSGGRIKACGIHYIFQNLCITEARKEKFFHVINNYDDSFAQDIESQRRLCIHNNVLFGIKDVYDAIASISNAYSLLCTGPYHQYPVPLCFGWMALKVIDAERIRFYNFPVQVLKLLQLRYLALTYDGNLPDSISKLQNLHYLIVRRHMNMKSWGDLPLSIWNMQQLRHLQVMGSDLVHPPHGASLPNLIALIGVSAISCSDVVLNGIPNLKKLGIQFIPSLDSVETFSIFNHFSHFDGLQTIKCVIMNPYPRSQVFNPPASIELPLRALKKLTLSGFGYPWEYMSQISALPKLEVLKLRCYAFRGPEWIISDGGFPALEFLLLEDIDLVHWIVGSNCFRSLETLFIRHCYKLEKIPPTIGSTCRNLKMIELVDCRPSVEHSVMQMLMDQGQGNGETPYVPIHSSWDDKKLKS